MIGTTLRVNAFRFDGSRVVRHYAPVGLRPLVVRGRRNAGFKAPDRCVAFMFDCVPLILREDLDETPRLLELWTRDRDGWLHWAFPHTRWDILGLVARPGTATYPFPEYSETAITLFGFCRTFEPLPAGPRLPPR